jgi:hypothetical protein
MKEAVKKPVITHKDCQSCDHRNDCFWLLHLWHLITNRCVQGRKSPVRVKAKDQAVLPIPEDTEVEMSCG